MKTRVHRRLILGTLALVIVASLATVASANPPHWRGRPVGGPGIPGGAHGRGPLKELGLRFLKAAEKLDLTDEQSEQLKQIRRRAPAAVMPKMQAVIEARMDLHDLLTQDDANKAQLRRAHRKVLEARTALQEATFELRIDARSVLTPEQREELKKSMRPKPRPRRPGAPRGPGAPRSPQGGWGGDEAWDF
ncbi:MAG: Spy/CpxP family protein refolding chaperone [Candidatus Krumholzibacteriia bacterium]